MPLLFCSEALPARGIGCDVNRSPYGDDEPLDAALKDMYSVSPNLVRSVDRAMCKEILVTMVGSVNQKKYKLKCEGSGLKLLLILDVEADEVGPAADAAISASPLRFQVTRFLPPSTP